MSTCTRSSYQCFFLWSALVCCRTRLCSGVCATWCTSCPLWDSFYVFLNVSWPIYLGLRGTPPRPPVSFSRCPRSQPCSSHIPKVHVTAQFPIPSSGANLSTHAVLLNTMTPPWSLVVDALLPSPRRLVRARLSREALPRWSLPPSPLACAQLEAESFLVLSLRVAETLWRRCFNCKLIPYGSRASDNGIEALELEMIAPGGAMLA